MLVLKNHLFYYLYLIESETYMMTSERHINHELASFGNSPDDVIGIYVHSRLQFEVCYELLSINPYYCLVPIRTT